MKEMKSRTLVLISNHLKKGELYFPDDSPYCRIFLTKGQIRDIIQAEYGIRPKKSRIVKKKLKQILDEILKLAINTIKDKNDKIIP